MRILMVSIIVVFAALYSAVLVCDIPKLAEKVADLW